MHRTLLVISFSRRTRSEPSPAEMANQWAVSHGTIEVSKTGQADDISHIEANRTFVPNLARCANPSIHCNQPAPAVYSGHHALFGSSPICPRDLLAMMSHPTAHSTTLNWNQHGASTLAARNPATLQAAPTPATLLHTFGSAHHPLLNVGPLFLNVHLPQSIPPVTNGYGTPRLGMSGPIPGAGAGMYADHFGAQINVCVPRNVDKVAWSLTLQYQVPAYADATDATWQPTMPDAGHFQHPPPVVNPGLQSQPGSGDTVSTTSSHPSIGSSFDPALVFIPESFIGSAVMESPQSMGCARLPLMTGGPRHAATSPRQLQRQNSGSSMTSSEPSRSYSPTDKRTCTFKGCKYVAIDCIGAVANRKRHMRRQHGAWSRCPICGKSIKRKDNFKKHMKTHHPNAVYGEEVEFTSGEESDGSSDRAEPNQDDGPAASFHASGGGQDSDGLRS